MKQNLPPKPGPKILVVDDDGAGREVLVTLLSGGGYRLLMATNGPDALDMAVELMPDLVLLDAMLPLMDGFEVRRRLRADPRVGKVPIILLTGLDDKTSMEHGRAGGADHFPAKPYDCFELQTRVRSITRLNRYRALFDEPENFERFFTLSPYGEVFVNVAGDILEANPPFVEMLGAENAALLFGRNIFSFIPPGQVDSCRECLGRALATPSRTFRVTTTLSRDDGAPVAVEIHAARPNWKSEAGVQLLIRARPVKPLGPIREEVARDLGLVCG